MKLSFKFFLAFLVTSVTIVVFMILTMRYYGYKRFADYVQKMEMFRLSEVVDLLSSEYENNNGWKSLAGNTERWRDILRPRRSSFQKKMDKLQAPPPDFPHAPPPYPPPPHPEEHSSFSKGQGKVQKPGEENTRNRPFNASGGFKGKPPWKRRKPRVGIEHRLTLFDTARQPVVGAAASPEGHTLREITAQGKTVGWLGLKKEPHLTNPLDRAFLKGQTQAFYIIGCVILILAAVVSYLLARHLLAPVQKLTEGTRAIASRDFGTRITIRTGDELGQLATDFNEMSRTLERYESMRRQWLSDIAHELRTPLSILRGEIEALQDGVRDITPETLGSLHAEVVHLGQLVQDLHDLSLAESGALQFTKGPVDPVAVLRNTVNLFQKRFVENQIAVTDCLGNAPPATIMGDRDRLTQLFSNLLENTLRYTDQPGALRLGLECTDTAVTIHVEDSAPGVPDDALEKIFDKLYRVDPARSRTRDSSGLGLAICKSIVEAHDGSITASNAASGGLKIAVIFPRKGG